jgi:hypothetical protein
VDPNKNVNVLNKGNVSFPYQESIHKFFGLLVRILDTVLKTPFRIPVKMERKFKVSISDDVITYLTLSWSERKLTIMCVDPNNDIENQTQNTMA